MGDQDSIIYIYIYIYIYMCVCVCCSLGAWGSIPDQIIPKTQKMEHSNVRIKSKVEQSWEWSSALPYTSV